MGEKPVTGPFLIPEEGTWDRILVYLIAHTERVYHDDLPRPMLGISTSTIRNRKRSTIAENVASP